MEKSEMMKRYEAETGECAERRVWHEMKFDKSKILTVVTADQAKVGQKGWFAILPQYIQTIMSGGQEPSVLRNIDLDSPSPFKRREGGYAWPLFYPEPTYAERQAEWVKENNVRFGTKVRFTKDFKTVEDGSRCCEHRDVKGKEGVVSSIHYEVIYVEGQFGIWACPFTALEVIKEPAYRPYNMDYMAWLESKAESYDRLMSMNSISENDIQIVLDGDAWCAYRLPFRNLQEDDAGFGATPQMALTALLESELPDGWED